MKEPSSSIVDTSVPANDDPGMRLKKGGYYRNNDSEFRRDLFPIKTPDECRPERLFCPAKCMTRPDIMHPHLAICKHYVRQEQAITIIYPLQGINKRLSFTGDRT